MDKKGGIWLIGLSLGILFFCMSFASAKIDDPVLWYKFDESTWSTNVWMNANADNWNSNDATVINSGSDSRLNGYASSDIAPISESTGHGVAVFNKGIIRARNFVDLGTGDLSISFWVQAISTSEMQSNGVSSTTPSAFKDMSALLSNKDVGTNNKGYGVFVSNNAFYIKVSNGAASKYMGVGLSDNSKWNHIVFVISRTGQSKVYVNGQVQNNIDSDITSGVFPGEDISYASAQTSPANSLYIGTSLTSQHNFFQGAIDDLRIYQHSLSQKDVSDLFDTEKSLPERKINSVILNKRFCSNDLYAGPAVADWSTPFTPASTTNKIKVRLWGGGGSGAVPTCSFCSGETYSGGGGGGGYSEKTFTPSSGQTYTTITSCGAKSLTRLPEGPKEGISAQASKFFISGIAFNPSSDIYATGGIGGQLGAGGGGGSGINGDVNLAGHAGLGGYTAGNGGVAGGQTSADCRFYQLTGGWDAYEQACRVGYQLNRVAGTGMGGLNNYYAPGYLPGGGGGGSAEDSVSHITYSGAGASGQFTAIEYSTTAQTTPPTAACVDEQTLFRLFANTNSHVSPYSDTNSPIRICYKDIFGVDYTGTDSHTCTSTNKIMGISTATNAHAENPSLANYDAKICYGNLACTLRDNTCGAGESAVASLSSDTNAHAALGTDPSYTKKICCKIGGATGLGVEHRQIYFANTNLNFAYSVTSPTNTVSWIIDEPDGTKITENQQSFTKSFTTAGQRTITITEKDTNGVIKAESQMAILIINDVSGVLTFINKPKHKEYISSEELKVDYSATDSYVIKLDVTNANSCTGRTITCLAGDCPTETKNAPATPAGCTNKVPVGGTRGANNYGNTEFNWMFNGPNQRVQGTGNSFATGTQGYSQKGEYRIDLTMKYSANNINIQSLLFQRVFTLGVEGCKNGVCSQCSEDRQWLVYLKADKTEESRRPTSTSLTEPAACAGSDEIIGTKDDCCPTGQECKPAQNNLPAGCYLSNYKSCGDYTTKELCEAGPGKAWETDDTRWNAGGLGRKCGDNWADGLCVYNVVCEKCRWVAEATGNIKKCQLEGKNRPSSDNPLICTLGKPTSVCTYTSTASSACESGFKTVDIDATPQDGTSNLVGVDNCVDRTVTIPCGRAVLELPFFGGWQIAGTLVIILVIYYLIIKKTMRGKRSSHQGRKSLSAIKNL